MQRQYYSHALTLQAMNLPTEAQAMALLVSWHDREQLQGPRPSCHYMQLCEAAIQAKRPTLVLPEVRKILELGRKLPHPMRSQRLAVAPADAGKVGDPPPPKAPMTWASTVADWPLEGLTPWVSSSTPFSEAVAFSDNPSRWHEAAAQVEVQDCLPMRPDGARWRARLTKKTDFGLPFSTELVAIDTIDITAEGNDAHDGSGFRRYSYVLHSSAGYPGTLDITQDEGWIEIAGDANGSQIRIQKRVTVKRPANDGLADILSAGFICELWLWAIGFTLASRVVSAPQAKAKPLVRAPEDRKKISRPAGAKAYRVCVLGGGPAGLACAWLLNRPTAPDGTPAWTGNANLSVGIIEQGPLPGGKAASGRRVDQGLTYRVEEHGLHMAMGCYHNLLKILEWENAENNLLPVSKVAIPCGTDASNLNEIFSIEFEAWNVGSKQAPVRLQKWSLAWQKRKLKSAQALVHPDKLPAADTETFSAAIANGRRVAQVVRPRPVMRMFAAASSLIAPRMPDEDKPWTRAGIAMSALGKTVGLAAGSEMTLAEAIDKSDDELVPTKELAALASLMRSFARAALPWDKGEADDRLAGEMLEFFSTVVIGLAEDAAVPMWALDQPDRLLESKVYGQWVRLLQSKLDSVSLADWLNKHGAAPGFALGSRVVGAVAAGLFTTPDNIAAGTFVNGFLRLLLTYEDAPFFHFKGGTGEAVIAPIVKALPRRIWTEAAVTGLQVSAGRVTRIDLASVPVQGVVAPHIVVPAVSPYLKAIPQGSLQERWEIPTAKVPPRAQWTNLSLEADAFVLAIPPFEQPIAGLPADLAKALGQIEHKPTISLQSWTDRSPNLPGTLVAGFAAPFRCLAPMVHLDEDFGALPSNFAQSPVYYCGDIVDAQVPSWQPKDFQSWLQKNVGIMQGGTITSSYSRVNDKQSHRYVSAGVATQPVRRYVYQTGLKNLWLAGDWTRTAMNCGSIEAAITSGLEAARDILKTLGCTVNFPIAGSILD